ncbi:uncharacterized protein LOC131144512 [Malania oleifera]|uniref:uncharacterized protein LOC131144512 n=1 Tax=Malania oleifera TaxID=397392 RepID=UPI0025AE2E8D|nr:uncharacterized protein LOC131144512 [Malania oleifera]
MEFFSKSRAVKLRGHLDKYLVADDDQETVRQSRKGSSRRAIWVVEFVEGRSGLIRLKSCHGRCLTASETPFLLGMTGKRVTQSAPETKWDARVEWEPVGDAFQVRLKTVFGGKYLRANGGAPPWRNSVTHDSPHSSATKNWVLWDVEAVDAPENEAFADYMSSASSLSSVSDDVLDFGTPSPMSTISTKYQQGLRLKLQSGMDLFRNAKAVRFRSHHDKYLTAEEDEESVTQNRNGSSKAARWTVEFVPGAGSFLRFKSCYGKYLTASNSPFLLGMTGCKALQTLPRRLDSSVEWEPIREGALVKLKTRYGNFLRANGGLPPWRNSITHDIPHRTATQEWILWAVDIVDIQVQSSEHNSPAANPVSRNDSLSSDLSSPSVKSATLSRQESTDSGSPPRTEGRIIYYGVADDHGVVDEEAVEGFSLNFKGNEVDELTRRLEEETGLEGIIVCSRSPLNGKLYPLRLQLPPNNTTMHVVVVQSSSKVARDFAKAGVPL